jgi:hypothetical protein
MCTGPERTAADDGSEKRRSGCTLSSRCARADHGQRVGRGRAYYLNAHVLTVPYRPPRERTREVRVERTSKTQKAARMHMHSDAHWATSIRHVYPRYTTKKEREKAREVHVESTDETHVDISLVHNSVASILPPTHVGDWS